MDIKCADAPKQSKRYQTDKGKNARFNSADHTEREEKQGNGCEGGDDCSYTRQSKKADDGKQGDEKIIALGEILGILRTDGGTVDGAWIQGSIHDFVSFRMAFMILISCICFPFLE